MNPKNTLKTKFNNLSKKHISSFIRLSFILFLLLQFSCTSSKELEKNDVQTTKTTTKKETKDERYQNDPLVLPYDVNKDGIADMWKIHKVVKSDDEEKKYLSRREIDLTYDGKVNYYKFYNEKGDITLEYLDLDLNGVIDSIVYYEKNQISKQEKYKKNPIKKDLSIDKDIPIYKRYLYANKKLDRVLVDRTENGVLDQYLFYKKDKLIQIAFDEDEDGKIDTRVRLKEEKKPIKEKPKNDK